MKILVTGAFGILGSNLCKRLIDDGHDVYPVDRDHINVKNLTSICKPSQLLGHDILHQGLMQKILDGEFEMIYHFADTPGELYCSNNPSDTLMNNTTKTCALFEAARDGKVKKFIYASSGTVYGKFTISPLSENEEINPQGFHALEKSFSEKIALKMNEMFGMNIYCFRIFNVYGRVHRSLDINSCPIKKTSLEVDKSVDLLHVSDFVDLMSYMIKHDPDPGIYNVGSGINTGVNEIKNALYDHIFIDDTREIDNFNFIKPDLSKLNRKINWSAKITDHIAKIKEISEEIKLIPEKIEIKLPENRNPELQEKENPNTESTPG